MYLRIMDDVIDNCHTTFEEEGVSQQTLEELRTVCVFSLCRIAMGKSSPYCTIFSQNTLNVRCDKAASTHFVIL